MLDRTGKNVPKVASCVDMLQVVNLTLTDIYKNKFGRRVYEFDHLPRKFRYTYTTNQLRHVAETLENEYRQTGRIDSIAFHEWE